MNTLEFLKQTIEEINPKLALGSENPQIEFTQLTIGEFEKLRTEVYRKYNKILRIGHMFECCGLVELSNKLDVLPVSHIYFGE